MTTTSQSIAKGKSHEQAADYIQAEISQKTAASMATAGAVIGIWSFASIVGALVGTTGPVSLAQSWFGAVTGM